MKKLVLALLLVLPLNVMASEETKLEKLSELLEIMDMDAIVETIHTQVNEVTIQASQGLNVSESKQAIIEQYYQDVNQMLREEVSWDKLKPMTMDVYMRQFTEAEISAMLAFYQTDEGQSILKKMPQVTQESMILSQTMMQNLAPRLQARIKQLHADIEEQAEQ
ncbi:DUF2059 domain-containing protein [Vibrio rotiferianus]|uniref:DUF2059 domain-containing protein n=1 Tax=Vibrio rotiferianus TaxID=190895 RepID=UPI00406A82AE